MKVTVFRRKLDVGLGPPQGFLGDDHPSEGDWVQSAKSTQPEGIDPHMMLHHMARDFLIRSMYHVTAPRFIGYAVENYGAACEALGYKLPLTEAQATWPDYERSEVDSANDDDYRWMLANITKVFGDDAAVRQARTLGVNWSVRLDSKPGQGRSR